MTAPAAVLLNPKDNVVVCCRNVEHGERVVVEGGITFTVSQDVAIGHKLACRDLDAGDKIIKYGASIGSATAAVKTGEWVHLHNMKSDYIDAHTRATQGQQS
jgi:hypothetical protein